MDFHLNHFFNDYCLIVTLLFFFVKIRIQDNLFNHLTQPNELFNLRRNLEPWHITNMRKLAICDKQTPQKSIYGYLIIKTSQRY